VSEGPKRQPFEIFRKGDYRDYGEHGLMAVVDPSPAVVEALTQFAAEEGGEGQKVSMAYSRPGRSLTHVWFKSGYPLPLHSHSGDCVYFILAGSIRVGPEWLGPGDGFFIGSDIPYTYDTGPEGAEVLEFRGTDELSIRFRAKGRAAWDKTVARLRERSADWASEPPPSERPRRTETRADAGDE
jgi:hypothetical protein